MAQRQYKQRYQYNTEAPKYPYQKPYPTPDKSPIKNPKTTPKPKPDVGFVVKMSMCASILFVTAVAFVHQSSVLSIKQREIKQANEEIRKIQSDISSIEAILATHLDLEYIQKIATEQLQMAEPLPHQVVYIQLSEESYTVYNE